MQRSSAQLATSGNSSLTGMPLSPWRRNSQGERISPPACAALKVSDRWMGSGFPWSVSNRGFGSKVSM